jgi:lactoylglutathione lyase
MRIHHAALWTADLEGMKAFYCLHFGAEAGRKYRNPAKGFESYFLSLEGGAALELMCLDGFATAGRTASGSPPAAAPAAPGYAHIALAVADPEAVDATVERLRAAGVTVAGEPRKTGDGYYEAVILDPDGNRVEIVSERRPG